MKERSMTWRNGVVGKLMPLVAAAATTLCSGCILLQEATPPDAPHATGRWTGRVVGVTVYDYTGWAYEAAGLRIESGPSPEHVMKSGIITKPEVPIKVDEEIGGGDLPLLAEGKGIPNVVPLSDLTVGQRLEVRGLMMIYSVLPPKDVPTRGGVSRILSEDGKLRGHEHILVIKAIRKN